MSKALDQDLPLKLRLRRLFFSQGYWSPIEVELSHYENLGFGGGMKRRSLTDLDVLGIKFDNLFTQHRVVADCKSGKNVSDASRLFWLRGVMDYFGADQAYFVRSAMDSHFRAVAPKMGLRTLNDTDLGRLERVSGADAFPIPLADVKFYQSVRDLWGIQLDSGQSISREQVRLKQVYSYLSYTYWYVESFRNLLTLIGHFEAIAELLNPQNERHQLLAFTGVSRFAHCLLETAQYVLSMGATDIPYLARVYLYGGALALKDKEKFFGLLQKATGFQESLDPPWLSNVTELLGRMVAHPSGASDVLRHLDAIYLWCLRLGRPSLPELTPGSNNTAALVLAKDVANAFVKASGIPESLFSRMAQL